MSEQLDPSDGVIAMRLDASMNYFMSEMQKYDALLVIGDPPDREKARYNVLFAVEAYLDLKEEVISRAFIKAGINPNYRHLAKDEDG
jgi:hypothetical protein